jgi:PTS system mannose-specific IIB component
MALAIPPGIRFEVVRVQGAAEVLRPGGRGPAAARTLVLLRDVRDAIALHEGGVPLPRLNLGNIHFGAGRRQVSPSVFLDEGELSELEALARSGTEVEIRPVPSETPLRLAQVKARFAAVGV